jgi:hypothetical protein
MVQDRASTTPCQGTRLSYLELQREASKGCVPRRDRKSLTTGHHGSNKGLRIRSVLDLSSSTPPFAVRDAITGY